MSGQGNKAQQAEKLLQAMGLIDDRFVLEAMQEQWPGAQRIGEPEVQRIEDGQPADQSSQPSGQQAPTGHPQSSEQHSQQTGQLQPKRRAGRIRRYSAWALTAAACLAVIVIGRFVSVSSVKGIAEKSTEISSAGKEADAAREKHLSVEQQAAADADTGVAADADAGAAAGAVPDAAPSAIDAGAAEEAENMILGAQEAGSASEDIPTGSAAEVAAEDIPTGSAAEVAAEDIPAGSAAEAAAEDIPIDSAAEAAGAAASIANPFVDTKTLEEAEKEAGFTIMLPALKETYDTVLYRAMKGKMIEVIYLDENQRECCRIRKGLNMEEDISGIGHEQARTKTLEAAGGIKVQAYGTETSGDGWATAVWTQEEGEGVRYSYSVDTGTSSFTTGEILNIVEEMSVK